MIRELEKLSSNNVGYQSLLEMENFQFNQKGPMSPIESRTVVQDVIPKLSSNSDKHPHPDAKAQLLEHIATVEKRYGNYMNFGSMSLHSIDFEKLWLELPSSSLRGIPFLKQGAEIDDLIVKIYGSKLKLALNQFTKIQSLITTPGLRIQGSPK